MPFPGEGVVECYSEYFGLGNLFYLTVCQSPCGCLLDFCCHCNEKKCFILSKRLTDITSATVWICIALPQYICICGNFMIDIITSIPMYISILLWSKPIEVPVVCAQQVVNQCVIKKLLEVLQRCFIFKWWWRKRLSLECYIINLKSFKRACEESGKQAVSYTKFTDLWKQFYLNVVMAKPMTDLHFTWQQNTSKLL